MLLRAGAGLKTAFVDKSLVKMAVGGASAGDGSLKETLEVQLRHRVVVAPAAHLQFWVARCKQILRMARYGY